ncbi:unnamed protein product [Amoebophrya sp. A120]|nr:unnamed protein product [Amoebophrya sp. A120]|eukprot:GSA120T00010767001.1
MMNPRTAAALLEVNGTASRDEIATAYKRLALKFHPDKNRDHVECTTEAFKLIQAAREVLLEATVPFYKPEDSPYDEERQEAVELKRRREQSEELLTGVSGGRAFFRRTRRRNSASAEDEFLDGVDDLPRELGKEATAAGGTTCSTGRRKNSTGGGKKPGDRCSESIAAATLQGCRGLWRCQVCGKDCLALRDNAVCGRCGNLLKMHTGVGHSLCHQGQYCPGFQLKVRSARCPCGHAPEDHVCIFFRDRTTAAIPGEQGCTTTARGSSKARTPRVRAASSAAPSELRPLREAGSGNNNIPQELASSAPGGSDIIFLLEDEPGRGAVGAARRKSNVSDAVGGHQPGEVICLSVATPRSCAVFGVSRTGSKKMDEVKMIKPVPRPTLLADDRGVVLVDSDPPAKCASGDTTPDEQAAEVIAQDQPLTLVDVDERQQNKPRKSFLRSIFEVAAASASSSTGIGNNHKQQKRNQIAGVVEQGSSTTTNYTPRQTTSTRLWNGANLLSENNNTSRSQVLRKQDLERPSDTSLGGGKGISGPFESSSSKRTSKTASKDLGQIKFHRLMAKYDLKR